jgi:hypothetical protein
VRTDTAIGTAKLRTGADELRSELAAGDASVEAALASLNALAAAGPDQLPAAFDAYTREVAALEAEAKQVARRAKHLRDAREEYLAKWSRDFERTSNPFTRLDAQQRRDKVRRGLDAVTHALQDTKAAYATFVRTLNEVRAPLAKELTPAAVMALKPAAERGDAEGRRVRERIAAVVAEMDRIGAASPSPSVTAD